LDKKQYHLAMLSMYAGDNYVCKSLYVKSKPVAVLFIYFRIIIITIIIITNTMFMVLSSWHSHCESSPGSFDECRTAPGGRRPKTKPDNLGRL